MEIITSEASRPQVHYNIVGSIISYIKTMMS